MAVLHRFLQIVIFEADSETAGQRKRNPGEIYSPIKKISWNASGFMYFDNANDITRIYYERSNVFLKWYVEFQ